MTETDFYRRSEAWLERFLEVNPTAATELGDHRWDDCLADNTPEALESRHEEMLTTLHEFQAMDPTGFSLDGRIDHTVMVHILKSLLREHDKIQGHLRNPGQYLEEVMHGAFSLIVKDFAPLPERLRSALGRARAVPRVLKEGQRNLVPERVPRVWVETTLEQARQAPGLFGGLLPAMAAEAAPELHQDLAEAGQAAAEAIEDYVTFLESDVLPISGGDFAAGREVFDEILREEHMVDYDADRLIEVGWEQFERTRTEMEEVGRQIAPRKTVQELLEESKGTHPTAEELLGTYERAMAAARRFIVEHDIVTIPEGESVRIIETPGYLWPVIPYAAYMPPGILEEEQEGIFVVTPVDPEASSEEQQQKLRGHSRPKVLVTAVHEAYPGHHLQLVWSNRQRTIPRRLGIVLANLFIEGWAFYCEEMMERLGYIAEPIQRLGRLSDQLWRAARIILDASLHTRGMSVEEGVRFLVEECQLEPANALAEVRRYTMTPTQPQSYLMGKLAILDLVEDYRRANPGASLREIHDAVLACGSLPPRLMRQRLLA